MGGWSLDLNKYAEKCKKNLNDVKKEVAISLYSSIVKKTPVDTGRARGNWHISVGQENYDTFDKVTKSPLKSEYSKMENSGDKPTYIQNNLPYIVALEYGHSKQAPNGMVGITVANMQKYIEKAIAEVTK